MTSHSNLILRLRISQEKGAKTRGKQRFTSQHTQQKFLSRSKQTTNIRGRKNTSINMPPKKKTKTNEGEEKSASFTWSDEELELLLDVIVHYKADKEGRGFDWQSVKTKYEDLKALFIERYPTDGSSTDFPHDAKNDFTKERINTKIKVIRQKYRVALDSGRRSGGGRIVAQFYDKCSEIWGGSPATNAFAGGIETSEHSMLPDSPESLSQNREIAAGDEEALDETAPPTPVGPEANSRKEIEGTPRRDLISHLKERRNSKMLKTIPAEKQFLDIAKADLEIKKDIMVELKKSNQENAEQMKVLTGTLVNLSNALAAALNPYQHSSHHTHHRDQQNLNPYQHSSHHNQHRDKHYQQGQSYNNHSFTQQQIPMNTNRHNTFPGTIEQIDEEHVFTTVLTNLN